MGKEARVIAEIGEWQGEGRLLLETDELIFRGAMRLLIPVRELKSVAADDGWLIVTHGSETYRFDIGPGFAEKWVQAIQNPRTLADKLDVKAGLTVALEGAIDPAFVTLVRDRVADSAAASDADIIFLQADDPPSLDAIPALRKRIKATGAIWVIHAKGRRELSHDAIMAIARPAGLVDVKSAKFSETHAALKLMVPRAQRQS